MDWGRLLGTIAKVAEITSFTVRTVEVVKGPGNGAEKKAAAMTAIKKLLGLGGLHTTTPERAQRVENLIGALIDISVEEDLWDLAPKKKR